MKKEYKIKGIHSERITTDEAAFWEQVEKDRKIVATWPKWKQKIVINAKTISTGQFNMSEKEWKKRYGKK